MTTIPSRLAQATRTSPSIAHARARGRALYREWYRNAPGICEIYALNVTPALVRARIREGFERHRHVEDPAVLDVVLLKGRQELQETLNGWKQESHMYGKLLADKQRPQKTFMQKFLEGRDEEAIIPASPQSSYP
ncbi:NADH-ubiquinone oxidoreductase Complex1 subunit [Cantharellus anzutake]|uniref:NADH-ubiquinone oxidoreductase Complex1 subunit n=1 Tax=Cantharellus anzutake TaxID=1750568 RepID=UPI00190903C4|nr:NADH-ubiquinone oxidoreductase Complex1 subunit [Cantharellus anzutake]KAF8335798.1 NADH-ubiquinone oxidoreductase Complex1 subunit [Cantharellus anzutake]